MSVSVVVATLVLAGCGSSSGSRVTAVAPGAPLRIGYLASLTGFCAKFAKEYVAGARLAVRRIDAQGGVLGHRLELIVRDDRATPSVGVAKARELVLKSHVKYLAGTCSSRVAKSVEQLVANPGHVLYVVGSTDPTMFEDGPSVYAFDTLPTTTIEGRNAAAYVRAHPRWKRIAVISEGYGYGYQVTQAFKSALATDRPRSASGQTIVSQQYLPSGGEDYFPYIAKLLQERPDVVYSTAITEDAVTFVREALARDLFTKMDLIGVSDYATLAHMRRAPVGSEGYSYYPSAAIYRTRFARDLEALGVGAANAGAAGDAFNQIEIIAQGIEKADSTDPTKVRDALGGATVETVQGTVKVHACDHQLAMPIAMGTVVGPNRALQFAHFESPRLVDTNRYFEC